MIYAMKLNVLRLDQVAACAVGGVAGAVIFLFAFPRGAISTLMHEVLSLPGPGAGVAVIIGPFAIVVGLIAALLTRRTGGGAIAGLTFAATLALLPSLLGMQGSGRGALGSPFSSAALALPGVVAEAVLLWGRRLKDTWRCMIGGAVTNGVLLGFYWIVVFPRTYKPVAACDVPLLLGLALAGGLLAGYIARVACNLLRRTFVLKET